MTFEIALQELESQLVDLRANLRLLDVTVVEDRPPSPAIAFVDRLSDAIQDLIGWTDEALAAVRDRSSATAGGRSDAPFQALAACQGPYTRLLRRYAVDVGSRDRYDELRAMGAERGPEWSAWARSAADALETCQAPMFETGEALLSCWRELAERAASGSISVQTTNVGQIVAPRRRVPEPIDR
jgi:hypothetical protein